MKKQIPVWKCPRCGYVMSAEEEIGDDDELLAATATATATPTVTPTSTPTATATPSATPRPSPTPRHMPSPRLRPTPVPRPSGYSKLASATTFDVTVGPNGDLVFSPSSVTIHPGDQVRWTLEFERPQHNLRLPGAAQRHLGFWNS